MKTITIKDARTGETLNLSHDPITNTYQINEGTVVRKPALEDQEDQFVFGSPTPGPSKLYHVTGQQLEHLKSAPDSPTEQ